MWRADKCQCRVSEREGVDHWLPFLLSIDRSIPCAILRSRLHRCYPFFLWHGTFPQCHTYLPGSFAPSFSLCFGSFPWSDLCWLISLSLCEEMKISISHTRFFTFFLQRKKSCRPVWLARGTRSSCSHFNFLTRSGGQRYQKLSKSLGRGHALFFCGPSRSRRYNWNK